MGLNLAYMVQNQLVFWPNYKKKKKKKLLSLIVITIIMDHIASIKKNSLYTILS